MPRAKAGSLLCIYISLDCCLAPILKWQRNPAPLLPEGIFQLGKAAKYLWADQLQTLQRIVGNLGQALKTHVQVHSQKFIVHRTKIGENGAIHHPPLGAVHFSLQITNGGWEWGVLVGYSVTPTRVNHLISNPNMQWLSISQPCSYVDSND